MHPSHPFLCFVKHPIHCLPRFFTAAWSAAIQKDRNSYPQELIMAPTSPGCTSECIALHAQTSRPLHDTLEKGTTHEGCSSG